MYIELFGQFGQRTSMEGSTGERTGRNHLAGRNWAVIDNDPAASFSPGGCVLFLKPAKRFRRDASRLSRLFLRSTLLHHFQGFFERTAFVFAGGGSLGSIQVGMLRALAAHGIAADMAVGCSVGALNAAYYAGTPTAEGVEQLAKIWLSLRRQDIFPVTWRTMLAFLLRRDFLVSADGVRQLVDLHRPYRNLEHAKLPVHVVATDLLSGEPVVLSKGSASQAILASTAIPAAFPPVLLERRYLADGAITCNTPVMVAVELGARRLVVLPTGYACALESPPRGAIACALHSLTLLIARQLLHELSSLAPEIDFCIVPPLCPVPNSPYDFAMTGELIERAAESTNAWIAGGGLTRREIVHHMHKHKHA